MFSNIIARFELTTELQLPFQKGRGAGFGTCYVNFVTVHRPVSLVPERVEEEEEGAKRASRPVQSGEEMCFKQSRGHAP